LRDKIFSAIILLFFILTPKVFGQDSVDVITPDSLKVVIEETKKSDSTKIIAVTIPPIDPNSWDFRLFTKINYNRSAFKNFFIPIIDGTMLPMAILMPVSMFGYGRLEEKTYDENTGYLLATSIITNSAVTFAIKIIVKRKRARFYLVSYGIYPKVYKVVDPYSFPSGHTSTAFTIATMFALRYPSFPQVYLPIFAWAATVGFGRMYLGMHYPSDVLVGGLIGAGSSILMYSLRKELFKFKNNILNENKNDEGSIQAGTLTIFTVGLLTSIAFNQVTPLLSSHIRLNTTPFHNNELGIGININYSK
jgi:membrane-associated phospholipid phosphatase